MGSGHQANAIMLVGVAGRFERSAEGKKKRGGDRGIHRAGIHERARPIAAVTTIEMAAA